MSIRAQQGTDDLARPQDFAREADEGIPPTAALEVSPVQQQHKGDNPDSSDDEPLPVYLLMAPTAGRNQVDGQSGGARPKTMAVSHTVIDHMTKEEAGVTTTLSQLTITKVTLERPRQVVTRYQYNRGRLNHFRGLDRRMLKKKQEVFPEKDDVTGLTRWWIGGKGDWIHFPTEEEALANLRR